MKDNNDRIKTHFEEEAVYYDDIIIKLIPYYKEMVSAITASLPFSSYSDKEIDVIDLGCGTGTISKSIQNRYLNARFTCVDLVEKMLEIAKQRIGENHCYLNADFNTFDFSKQYDIIVSSLALHHLESDDDKQLFYNKIYKGLKKGGIFINADVVQANNQTLQDTYMEKWVEYMNRSVSKEEIDNKWLPNYYAEDKPIPMMNHLEMLINSGFVNVDVIWKYYGFAVYTGRKE